ncbi:PTS sugar transporter subunit IIA [Enemella sp. A6]|uniref:PTS sugar transporter subunit IIA n=1 Tax=Enemella sp. A6 TaxID=3440152 RepID=UPI003EBF3C5A
MEFHEHLMFPNLTTPSRDELLQTLGKAVIDAGYARDDYVTGLQEREAEFPTGLPISGGVAIPHTSAEYAKGDTIAVATLVDPVTFHEMGGDEDSEVETHTVFLLVFSDPSEHVTLLSRLVKLLQDQAFVNTVREAPDAATLTRILSDHIL